MKKIITSGCESDEAWQQFHTIQYVNEFDSFRALNSLVQNSNPK